MKLELMSHVRGQLSWSSLILGNYLLATLSHHHSMDSHALEKPKTLTKTGSQWMWTMLCSFHSCQLSSFRILFYVCWQMSNDNCKQFTAAADFKNVSWQSLKLWVGFFFTQLSTVNWIGILRNCESVLSPAASPNLLQTKCRCSPSINKLLLHLCLFLLCLTLLGCTLQAISVIWNGIFW